MAQIMECIATYALLMEFSRKSKASEIKVPELNA